MGFCTNCGAENSEGTKFCIKCGQRIGTGTEAVSNTAMVQAGKNVSDTVNVTSEQVSAVQSNRQVDKKNNKKPWLPIIIGVASVFIFFVIAIASEGGGNKGSLENMLSIVDRAREIYFSVSEGMRSEEAKKRGEELAALKEELHSINCSTDNKAIYEAEAEYLDLLIDCNKDLYDLLVCKEEYDLLGSDIQSIELPDWREYNDMHKYYDDSKVKWETFKNRYSGADLPPTYQQAKDRIIAQLSKGDKALYKMATGLQKGDLLRYWSGINNLNRIIQEEIVLEAEIEDFYNEQVEATTKKEEKSDQLYQDIYKAANLTRQERENYAFDYSYKDELYTSYDVIETIYPALYNTYDHFAIVEVASLSGEKDLIIEAEIPGLSQKMSGKFKIGTSMTPIYLKPPATTEIVDLKGGRDSQLKIDIKDSEGKIIDSQSFPVHICSENDFGVESEGFGIISKDNILCFLEPESEKISTLKRKAINIVSKMTGGRLESINGYQTKIYGGYGDTYLQVAAIMQAMSDEGVRYTYDAFSIDGAGQHVLLPHEVLEQKTGLCLETSLVIASALQSSGFNTYLVFPPGHAQVAVETGDGTGDYYLIETTSLPCDMNSFMAYARYILKQGGRCDAPVMFLSKAEWEKLINDEDSDRGCYVVDCSDGAWLGLTPFAR